MLEDLYEKNKEHLSKSDLKIMECLMRNQEELQYMTTEELAGSLKISASTISRFWPKIGFQNIKDFKKSLREHQLSTPSGRLSSALNKWNDSDFSLSKLALQYNTYIEKTFSQLNPDTLTKAAQMIVSAKKIYFLAPDASVGLAAILQYRCRRLGLEFIPLKSGSELYESMINFTSEDLILMFSYSRLLTEIQVLLKHSRIIHYKTILFTDLLTQKELPAADLTLYSYRGEPNEYHSMVTPMTVIDLLIMRISQLTESSVEKLKCLEGLRNQYLSYIKR